MSSIDAIGTAAQTAATGGAGQASLDKDAFLRLLVAQLQHQDPLDPLKDSEFMGQMAQFSTLEQITNMSDALGRLADADQLSQAVSVIGRQVTYTRDDGSTASGVVQSVRSADGRVVLDVDGVDVAPSSITSIA